MSLILNIDSATTVCSVALSRENNILSLRETKEKNAHSSILTIFISEVMQEASLSLHDLYAIAVSIGPGSYTGLRIGVATVKGLCYALDRPLIAIPTLLALAWGMKDMDSSATYFCPMIDARRMEVYCAVFDHSFQTIRETKATIIDESSFSDLLKNHVILFAGEGAGKCKTVLMHHSHVRFGDGLSSSARFMIPFSHERFTRKQFEDISCFEPFYLKDFIAGKSKIKGL